MAGRTNLLGNIGTVLVRNIVRATRHELAVMLDLRMTLLSISVKKRTMGFFIFFSWGDLRKIQIGRENMYNNIG
jgi:hypothetical protein